MAHFSAKLILMAFLVLHVSCRRTLRPSREARISSTSSIDEVDSTTRARIAAVAAWEETNAKADAAKDAAAKAVADAAMAEAEADKATMEAMQDRKNTDKADKRMMAMRAATRAADKAEEARELADLAAALALREEGSANDLPVTDEVALPQDETTSDEDEDEDEDRSFIRLQCHREKGCQLNTHEAGSYWSHTKTHREVEICLFCQCVQADDYVQTQSGDDSSYEWVKSDDRSQHFWREVWRGLC